MQSYRKSPDNISQTNMIHHVADNPNQECLRFHIMQETVSESLHDIGFETLCI